LDDEEVRIWCEIQLGHSRYTKPLGEVTEKARAYAESKSKKNEQALDEATAQLRDLGLEPSAHYSPEELILKANKAGGGYVDIGFVEERYLELTRRKRGNDGTYYQVNLNSHLSYVRKAAYQRAVSLYNRVAFYGAPASNFDVLKEAVNDRLLDINPELAERLMTAFRAVSGENPEEWSQALTTCRRFVEGLADSLYPPKDEQVKGRAVGKSQYINRLWAFMDGTIESQSNRELAKAHVDYLGGYLQKIHKLSNKGVHATLTRLEAIKAVFHTYLLAADILDYLDTTQTSHSGQPNIHTATLDELESLVGVSRGVAKDIVRLRVEHGVTDEQLLSTVRGIGPKTLARAVEALSFEPASQDLGA
jgi:DNA uptake protein ComE-like DNA-binding protein